MNSNFDESGERRSSAAPWWPVRTLQKTKLKSGFGAKQSLKKGQSQKYDLIEIQVINNWETIGTLRGRFFLIIKIMFLPFLCS